jgi:SAM-dependent methyltransferase
VSPTESRGAAIASDWRVFWDKKNDIYVGARHRALHYRHLADGILSVLPERAHLIVLDYGCGEALDAGRVAGRVERLMLFDPSAWMQARLVERFAAAPGLAIASSEDLDRLAPQSLDVVVINSVAQYIGRDEFSAILDRIARWLRPDGFLILSDIVPKRESMIADIGQFLMQALRNGYFLAGLRGLAATFSSDYRRIRVTGGFSRYDTAEIEFLVAGSGLRATRHPENFGLNQRRMTFLCRKVSS